MVTFFHISTLSEYNMVNRFQKINETIILNYIFEKNNDNINIMFVCCSYFIKPVYSIY
jgi:hypothetical protein